MLTAYQGAASYDARKVAFPPLFDYNVPLCFFALRPKRGFTEDGLQNGGTSIERKKIQKLNLQAILTYYSLAIIIPLCLSGSLCSSIGTLLDVVSEGRDKEMEIRVGENESLESALKRFKRKCARSGVLAEVRRREHYEKPSVKRKKKAEAARKRK